MVARLFSTAAVVAALSVTAAQAQSSRVPAEIPPEGYSASQYVDSRGCVFIRAGFNGATTWVPRFGDDRQPMCGYAPSMQGGAAAVAQAAPTQEPTQAPAQVTVRTAMAPAPVVPTGPAVAPRRAMAPSLSAGATRIPFSVPPETSRPAVHAQAQAPAAQPQARVYQAQAGGLDTRWSFYDRTGPSPCAHYSPHSQMYAVPSPAAPDQAVRCGPQAQHPADALREQSPRGGVWEPWDGANPYPGPNNNVYMLPAPYAPRWPQPYLQGASGLRYDAEPARRAAPRATVSTMGTTVPVDQPRRSNAGQLSNGQYVQVGTFGVPANARATISRLQASGMPVATSNVSRGNQQLQVVLAGPFTSQTELSAALSRARGLGFGDAFVR